MNPQSETQNTKYKILIVDDEPANLKLMSALIANYGHSFETASNGLEAIEKAKEMKPDIIILDVLMPVMDGIEACKRLKKDPDIMQVPVVILTALGDNKTKIKCLEAGANDFLTKPVDHADLIVKIRNLLQLKDAENKNILLEKKISTIETVKRLEEQIRTQYNFLKTIIESFGYPFYVIDVNDYTIKIANKAAQSVMAAITEKTTCHELTHRSAKPCESAEHPCTIKEIKRTGSHVVLEHVHYDNAGNARLYEVYGYPIFDDNGAIIQIIEYSVDITERKQMEMALKENEERLRIILNSIRAGIILIDTESHKIVDVNPVAAEMIGVHRDQIVGHVCHRFVCPAEKGSCPITDLKKTVDNSERVLLKADGTTVPVLKTVTPIILGGREHLLEIFVDITERKQTEMALKESQDGLLKKNEELNQLTESLEITNAAIDKEKIELQFALDDISFLLKQVAEEKDFGVRFKAPESDTSAHVDRLGELFNNMMHILETQHRELEAAYSDLKTAQTRITQQEKMASIGQLAAGVAHEINNPMGFIMSNLGTLQKYIDKFSEFIKAQAEAIEDITKESGVRSSEFSEKLKETRKSLKIDYITEDIGNLIKESLEGADRVKKIVQDLKSFSRVDEAEQKVADINAGIESTINIVWNELKYKATVKREYGDIPMIKCNPSQLNQVFMNMLVNAAHAIEKQGEITVKTWHEKDNIYVSISDTGCGIPEDKINRIFEPFYTTKEVGKGTGLGLSITYDIVKKHNGDITVQSEPGKGTTFTVRIPVVEG